MLEEFSIASLSCLQLTHDEQEGDSLHEMILIALLANQFLQSQDAKHSSDTNPFSRIFSIIIQSTSSSHSYAFLYICQHPVISSPNGW